MQKLMHALATEPSVPALRLDRMAKDVPFGLHSLWLLVGLATIEWLWARMAGFTLTQVADSALLMLLPIAVALVLAMLGLVGRVAYTAFYLGLWMGWLLLGALLSYLAAALPFELIDLSLSRLDAQLGFDWVSWMRAIEARPWLTRSFAVVYAAMFVQILWAIVFLSHPARAARAQELWWTMMICVIVVCLASGVLPALGTFHYYDELADRATHIPHLLALRDGSMRTLPLLELTGIVTFPSYHAASAVLLCYPYRHSRRLFAVVCALNAAMLVSVPSRGGHYLCDVIGGALVALAVIYLYRGVVQRRARRRG